MGLQDSGGRDQYHGRVMIGCQQGAQVPNMDAVLTGRCGQPVRVAGRLAAAQVVRVEGQTLDQLTKTKNAVLKVVTPFKDFFSSINPCIVDPDPSQPWGISFFSFKYALVDSK
jgi:hypothetical protein